MIRTPSLALAPVAALVLLAGCGQQPPATADASALAAKEAELNARLAAAEARISDTRTKAMANVSAVAEDAAAAIAEKLTGAKPSPAAVKAAVAGAMGG